MSYAIKASLFLILGALVMSTPEADMELYKSYRSPILDPLGDLQLSEAEALQKISANINSVMGLPNNSEHKDFWIDLISKKSKYQAPASADEDMKKPIIDQINLESKALFRKVDELKNDASIKGEEALLKAQSEATVHGFKSICRKAADNLAQSLLVDLKQQFAFNIHNSVEDPKLEKKKTVATDLVHAVIDEIKVFIEKLNVDIEESLPEELQSIIYASLSEVDPILHQMAQILNLITNGSYMLQIEALNMFAAIQHFTEVPAATRISRMFLISRLLVLFGHLNQTWGNVERLIITIIKYRKSVLRGETPEDAAFAKIYAKVARDLVVIINQQAGTELSFDLAKRLIIVSQEVKQSQAVPFLLAHTKSTNWPLIPRSDLPKNSRYYLKTISIISALTFKDIDNKWWDSVLFETDHLLEVDAGVTNVLAYGTLQLSESITPLKDHEEFLSTHFNALLEFLEVNGEYVTSENYFKHFSTFIDLVYEKSELAKKYYFLMKVQNIYASPTTSSYPINFLPYAPSEKEAKELGEFATAQKFDNLRKLIWNAYVTRTKDNTGKAQRAFKHFLEFSGKTQVPFETFNHANFQFTVDDSVRQKRPASSFKEVTIKVSEAQASFSLKQPSPKDKSPNKISIDAGSNEEKQLVDDLANNIPALTRHDANPVIAQVTIPNEPLEKLVQDQIKETKEQEKIEEQITKLLIDPEVKKPEETVSEIKENVSEAKDETVVTESPVQKKDEPIEQKKEEPVVINEIAGALTPKEKKLLEQKNLRELLGQVNELIDEDGNSTKLVYVKMIPRESQCYNSIFA